MIRFKPDIPVINRGHPQARNLLAAWPHFEGGGDSKTLDIGPGRFHGTFQGSPAWSVDKYGRALTYNGTNAWLDMGNVLNMGTDNFTVVVLVKGDSGLSGDTTATRIIQKRGTGGTGSNAGWVLGVRQSGGNVTVRNSVFDDGSTGIQINSDDVLGAIGDWLPLALRIDRDSDLFKIFSGGDEKTSQDISSVTGSVDNSRNFTIGAADTTETQWFAGEIADARLYQGLLSVNMLQEIASDHFALYRQPRYYWEFASQEFALPPLGEVSATAEIDMVATPDTAVTTLAHNIVDLGMRVEIDEETTKDFRNVQSLTVGMGMVMELDHTIANAAFTTSKEEGVDMVGEVAPTASFEQHKEETMGAVMTIEVETFEGSQTPTAKDLSEATIITVPKVSYIITVPRDVGERES